MKRKLTLMAVVLFGGVLGIGVGWRSPIPKAKEITISARRYAFQPPVIKVNYGDTLKIKLVSQDVVHGFYLEGYDVDARVTANTTSFKFRHPSEGESWQDVESFSVIANKRGKFRYRCSQTCGTLHPFMQGELIVEPNLLYYGGFGSVFGLFVGVLTLLARNRKSGDDNEQELTADE